MKTVVIYHRADFDGLFCREIAKKFLPGAELIGWDYGDPVPELGLVDRLYMLDISIAELMDCPCLVWIDHHKSAIEKFTGAGTFAGGIAGYRLDGVAACRLAWVWFETLSLHHDVAGVVRPDILPTKQEFVDRTVSEPQAVRLAGEYDIWDKRDERADIFQFGLRSRELTDEDWKWLLTIQNNTRQGEYALAKTHLAVAELLENGSLLQKYQRGVDAAMIDRSFVLHWEGLRFLALNTARCNSLTFAAADTAEHGHDALMGFYWNGASWNFSLYHANHRKDLDLSLIAVKHGGGGHRGACGFRMATIPFAM